MLISMAHAQDVTAEITAEAAAVVAEAPSATSAFAWNMGMVLVLVFLFYFLLIKPQQKRFLAHKELMDGLNKGDKVATAGGLIGKIDKLVSDKEVIVDLGNGVKVTALRHTISDVLNDDADKKPPLKDDKKKEDKKK